MYRPIRKRQKLNENNNVRAEKLTENKKGNNMKTINVYLINGKKYYAAETERQALELWQTHGGTLSSSTVVDHISWEQLEVLGFKKELEKRIADKEEFPQFLTDIA